MRLCLAGLALRIVMLILLTSAARAHDYWSDGKRVDPKTKNLCCSGSDTKELDVSQIGIVKGGYWLRDTGEFISNDRVQPSPDGAYWASRWGGETRCFFAPNSF